MNQASRALALLILGSACIVGGVVALVGVMAPTLLGSLIESTGPTPQHKLQVTSIVHVHTAGPSWFRVGNLDVTYPSAMRENETRPVEVTYTVKWGAQETSNLLSTVPPNPLQPVPTDPLTQTLEKLDRGVKLELTSSGFSIEPKGEVSKQEETPLPTKQVWTVTPTAEGSRSLLLRVEEKEGGNWPTYEALINGASTQPDAGGFYVLPVSVTTFWGVSRLWASLIGFALTLIGAVLSYPIVVSILRRLLGLKGEE